MEINRKKRESGFPKLTQNWNPSDFGSWLYIIGIVENNRLKSRVVINGGETKTIPALVVRTLSDMMTQLLCDRT